MLSHYVEVADDTINKLHLFNYSKNSTNLLLLYTCNNQNYLHLISHRHLHRRK
jgi:hypothetical protein